MKKLLVLSLVLAVAGLANAGLSLVKAGPNEAKIVGANATGSGFPGFLFTQGADITGQLIYAGSLAEITPMDGGDKVDLIDALGLTGVNQVFLLTFADGSGTPALANGDLAKLVAKGQTIVTLTDGDLGVMGSVTLVPEPMTMGLLSLGALFIRKRK